MYRGFAVLWSLKLTVVLLAATALYAAAATALGLSFRSPLFLSISALFMVNLSACTVRRLVTRAHPRPLDYLPDGIHVALLIVLIGGLLSLNGRFEHPVALLVGDELSLGPQMTLELHAAFATADNWESQFTVHGPAEPPDSRVYTARVNEPLRLRVPEVGPVELYQTGFSVPLMATLTSSDGTVEVLGPGDGFTVGVTERYWFEQEGAAGPLLVAHQRGGETATRRPAAVGDQLAGLRITAIEPRAQTVVTIVRDPGQTPALIGAVLLTIFLSAWAITRRTP